MESQIASLTIRCAHQSHNDMVVDCPVDWTVLQLKTHLMLNYPSKPEAAKQRLIYSGQLLKDDAKLQGILRDFGTSMNIVHLVYVPAATELKVLRQQPIEQRTIASNNEPELRHRNVAATQNFDMNALQQPQFNNELANPSDFMQQYMASWANYNNYMQLLQQAYGSVYMPGMMASASFPANFPATGIPYYNWNQPAAAAAVPQPQEDQQQQLQPQANAGQQQVNAAEDPAMNAQGGLDEEDFRERDWLDYLYMGSRLMLLFMILYFYSSMQRFLFVTICCILVYGYQQGWFGRRAPLFGPQPNAGMNPQPNAGMNPPPPPNLVNNNAQGPQGNLNPNAQENAETLAAERNLDANLAPPVPPEIPSAWTVFWTTCYTFIFGFFRSMIPERPQPVNAN